MHEVCMHFRPIPASSAEPLCALYAEDLRRRLRELLGVAASGITEVGIQLAYFVLQLQTTLGLLAYES